MSSNLVSSTIPCVIFGFNRPDFLEQVLDSLKRQNISKLIIFIDGPRDKSDINLVEQSCEVAHRVDWTETEFVFKQENGGLLGIADNITRILSEYQAAVFVEDDCLPMPAFYSFMCAALRQFEHNKQVFSIGGYQIVEPEFFKDYSYSVVSGARFMCWGWATWKDRWELVRSYSQTYTTLFDNLNNVPGYAGCDIPTTARACALGAEQTWDTPVAITTLWLKQVHLIAVRGLIKNLGNSGTGTHDGTNYAHFHGRNVWQAPLENLMWPDDASLNKAYLDEVMKLLDTIFKNTPPSLLSRIAGKIKSVFTLKN